MARFRYKGRNTKGKLVEGIIESVSKEGAISLLKRDKIIPIEVAAAEKNQDPLHIFWRKLNSRKPTIIDMTMFSRQMFALIRAGVPIIRAIKLVADNVKNDQLEDSLDEIAKNLESGQALALSMRKHHKIYPAIMAALVDIGENSGTLDEVFRQIAVHMEREAETVKRVKAAMRYPIMVVMTIAIAVTVINLVVIPSFKGFFEGFNSELPMPTQILIFASDITVYYWHYILAGIGAIVFAWISYLKTARGTMNWDRWKLKLPLIGTIVNMSLLARFARSFALTARSGLPLLDAITIISKVTDNSYVGKHILEMRTNIEHGESLAVSAEHSGMFTPLVLQMFSIGEETGDVDRLMDEVGEFYEAELDYQLRQLSSAIEPILISIVAALVLVLALGVFLPMWEISQIAIGGTG